MRQNNAMSSPAWQKWINALLITLHSLPRGTWSDLTDHPPSRASTWSIRSPERAPPLELLHRLDRSQRERLFRLWNTVPPHMCRIDFALDAAGWDPAALDALSTTLATFADVFLSSKLDYGEYSLRPFEIKVLPGTQPIQSRPYRLNPVLSKQADAILDSYLAAGLIQHSTSPWSSPLVCVPKKCNGIQISPGPVYPHATSVTRCPGQRWAINSALCMARWGVNNDMFHLRARFSLRK